MSLETLSQLCLFHQKGVKQTEAAIGQLSTIEYRTPDKTPELRVDSPSSRFHRQHIPFTFVHGLFLPLVLAPLSAKTDIENGTHQDSNSYIAACSIMDTTHADNDQEDASGLVELAENELKQLKLVCNISDLNTAVYLFRHAIYLLRRDVPHGLHEHPLLSDCLDAFATTLLTRFLSDRGQTLNLFNACGFRFHVASRYPPIDYEGWLRLSEFAASDVVDDPRAMIGLASDIVTNFHQSADETTLNSVIFLLREARSVGSESANSDLLFHLADALLIRFRLTSRIVDLQDAIDILKQLYRMRPSHISCLCAALLTVPNGGIFIPRNELLKLMHEARMAVHEVEELNESGRRRRHMFEVSGDPSDIDAAIVQIEHAKDRMSWGFSGRTDVNNNLANALTRKFQCTGNVDVLDKAIEIHRKSLADRGCPIALQSLATCLNMRKRRHAGPRDLASSLEKRFQQTRNTKDIDRAIQLRQEALDSANPTNRIRFLHNVSYGLSERAGIKDLDSAIDIDRQVLALRPPGHAHRALSLNNLALNLYKRSKRGLEGHKADLDNAIDLYG
ncbi:hypothetical protein B0H13DRAFT_2400657 [Mycena leptocephala]|nr:hypothetical protein B0H13DRAFT_2400657 [Mycena leptocephala]